MGTLDETVAIVTGASQGIGRAAAKALGAAGARLCLVGRNGEKLESAANELRRAGVSAITVTGDVRARQTAHEAVSAAMTHFGRLDALLNVAQESTPGTRIEAIDEAEIARTLESGLLATLYFMQASFPVMKEAGGSIVNFGSAAGIVGDVGFGMYGATKEAIRGLSKIAAREWGQFNIRVNVVVPAAETPAAETFKRDHPAHYARIKESFALGRLGDPLQDIGPVLVFLASQESRYITGQTLNVNGGRFML